MRTTIVLLGLSLLVPFETAAQDVSVPNRLTLQEALHLAEARSPHLAAARQLAELAKSDVTGAARRPNPTVTVEGEAYPLFESPLPSFWNDQALTFRFDQEIETAGRRGLRMEIADTGIAVARADIEDRRRRLHVKIGRTYFQLALAQADGEVATAALNELERVIGLTEVRFDAGEVAGTELRRLQVERLRFVDDVLAAELAARNTRATLLGMLNASDLSQPIETIDPLSSPPLVAPDGRMIASADGVTLPVASLQELAFADRPDVRAARLRQVQAETETRRQRARRAPNVTAGWGYRRHFGTNRMEFGVTLPVPLFTSLNPGGIERAEAQRRQTDALAGAAAIAADVELQKAVNAVEISAERVRYIQDEYLVTAEESLDITQASYALGAANLIDFLDAQRAFQETQHVRNQALFALRISLIELEAALGLSTAPRRDTL